MKVGSICKDLRTNLHKIKSLGSACLIVRTFSDYIYVVKNINFDNCIFGNFINFISYLKNSDITEKDVDYFGVSIPVADICSFEIHRILPKTLQKYYKADVNYIGFTNNS